MIVDDLLKKKYTLITPIKIRKERSAIVHFKSTSFEETTLLYKKLKKHKVILTLQGAYIRVSPNFFTTKEEIELFLGLI
jgi:selenocysteine lyase/cysteine desulfurase